MVERTDFSAGGVLLDVNGRVVVIEPSYRRGETALPKGHPEAGENAWTAALREVREETGYDAALTKPRRSTETRYTFRCPRTGDTVHKRVRFFLMRIVGGSSARHDAEVVGVHHLLPREALSRLTYATEQGAVRRLVLRPHTPHVVAAAAAIMVGSVMFWSFLRRTNR